MTEYEIFKKLCKEGCIALANSQEAKTWCQSFLAKGLKLETSNNKIILNDKITALDLNEINNFLPESYKFLSEQVSIIYQTTSTNTVLREENTSLILLTEYQSAGKGRNNRGWVSPVGHNIYLSIKLPYFKNSNISFLPIYISVLLVEALSEAGVEGLSIKWPNDIYLYNKKVSGSILDCYSSGAENLLILGIGINVTMPVNGQIQIDQDFTSFSQFFKNELINRNYLLSFILPSLFTCLDSYKGKKKASTK